MRPKEIRELTTDEIRQRISEEERDLQQLRFQHSVAQIEDPLVLRRKRRIIARLKTIIGERQEQA